MTPQYSLRIAPQDAQRLNTIYEIRAIDLELKRLRSSNVPDHMLAIVTSQQIEAIGAHYS